VKNKRAKNDKSKNTIKIWIIIQKYYMNFWMRKKILLPSYSQKLILMEIFDNLEQKTGTLEVTEDSKKYLKTAATWSKFIAIVQFVAMGFLIFAALIMFIAGSFMESYANMPFSLSIIGWCYLVIGIVVFFPTRYLYLFAKKAAKAVATHDTLEMEDAFKNMKSYWKFTGIMMVVALGLSITVVPVVVIIAAVSGAF